MLKLKKSKSFEVSKNTEFVTMGGKQYEIANLLKSGLTMRSKILIAIDEEWHEIDVLNLGADNSDLTSFINHVNLHNLNLTDFGLKEKKQTADYKLTYLDHQELEKQFPDYNYIEIAKLEKFLIETTGHGGKAQLKIDLKHISSRGITINEYIAETKASATEIINNHKSKTMSTEKPETAQEEQTHVAEPVTETPKTDKKPISLSVISSLQPSRITELKDLEKQQQEIVAQNPIIPVTDKASREKAQKQATALLKASTAIDGKTGIIATFVTHANQFIKMGKDYLSPIAKITRDKYDEQKRLIEAFDNAEDIRVQEEKKAKLTKIKERTDRLFAVPFIFNGQLYSIGTLYVMPSEIENMTDEEFNATIVKAEAIAKAEKSKDDEIRELKEKLQKLLGESEEPATVEQTATAEQPAIETKQEQPTAQPVATTQTQTAKPAAAEQKPASNRFVASTEYILPDPNNKVVNDFDMAHFGIINENPIPPAFIKCRAYFIEGAKQLANEIDAIMAGENIVNGLKKSERIAKLCEIVKATK